MRLARRAFLSVSAAALAPAAIAALSGQSTFEVQHLGVAVTRLDMAEGYVTYGAPEMYQGQDLNGDGDQEDIVFHIYDLQSGRNRNTHLVSNSAGAVVEGWVAVPVQEQGEDLNEDGDVHDRVMHLVHAETGELINLKRAGLDSVHVGSRLFFPVVEDMQGMQDLNGNHTAENQVLHAYDLETRTLKNLRLATDFAESGYQSDGNRLAVRVFEHHQGVDFSGDGDQNDRTVLLVDLPGFQVTNTGLTAGGGLGFRLYPDLLLVDSYEVQQGETDLNGDGEISGEVTQLLNLRSGALWNLGQDVVEILRRPDQAAYTISETLAGQDLNGDGDALDRVLQIWTRERGTVNTGIAGGDLDWNEEYVAIQVHEGNHGQKDLNGNGTVYDSVLHLVSLRTGAVVNLETSGPAYSLHGDHLLVSVAESSSSDLNGDGDTLDLIAELIHIPTLERTNYGLAVGYAALRLSHRLGVLGVPEQAQGQDLDGDGTLGGTMYYAFELGAAPVALGFGGEVVQAWEIDSTHAAFRAREGHATGDLNGDGDTNDQILTILKR